MKKKLLDLNVKHKVVILRCDLNVPIENQIIQSTKRIIEAMPTIKYLVEHKSKIVIMSHLGRVKSEKDKANLDLKIVAECLAELLNLKVKFVNATKGLEVERAISEMQDGEIIMLQNTRYEDLNNFAESHNSPELGKYWASLGDIFINDGFGVCHRNHASTVGIAKNIPESAIGFLVEKEMKMLGAVANNPEKPFVAIIGGAKISDKIDFINNLLKVADKIILAGGMAYTFLKSQGFEIGNSLVEKESLKVAQEIMNNVPKGKIILPIDFAIAKEFANEPRQEKVGPIPKGYQGLDVGTKTIELFSEELQGAKTVLWNGPLGVTEFSNFAKGTDEIARIIANLKGVFSIIGGGDSAAAAIKLGYEKQFTHISTGGGASLSFMKNGKLPAIEAIQDQN